MAASRSQSLVAPAGSGNPLQDGVAQRVPRRCPSSTPPEIHVRDYRLDRDGAAPRWWLAGDPVATAWHNALSATFPRGEAFFIETVRACREGAPPALDAAIRAFVAQEVNHSREHAAFNRQAAAAGYDLARIDRRVADLIGETVGKPPLARLAITMALEHFTAMFAHEFLSNPGHFAGCEPAAAALWQWHATEEIEHKGVAFDTFRHAAQGWPRRRRWLLRASIMLLVTRKFLRHRFADALDLLAQDGIAGWRARARLAHYLVVRPGVLRRIFPAWLGYFRPGFHPWDLDDRALLAPPEAAAAGD